MPRIILRILLCRMCGRLLLIAPIAIILRTTHLLVAALRGILLILLILLLDPLRLVLPFGGGLDESFALLPLCGSLRLERLPILVLSAES